MASSQLPLGTEREGRVLVGCQGKGWAPDHAGHRVPALPCPPKQQQMTASPYDSGFSRVIAKGPPEKTPFGVWIPVTLCCIPWIPTTRVKSLKFQIRMCPSMAHACSENIAQRLWWQASSSFSPSTCLWPALNCSSDGTALPTYGPFSSWPLSLTTVLQVFLYQAPSHSPSVLSSLWSPSWRDLSTLHSPSNAHSSAHSLIIYTDLWTSLLPAFPNHNTHPTEQEVFVIVVITAASVNSLYKWICVGWMNDLSRRLKQSHEVGALIVPFHR